ncbi:metallophosphoesterase [methanogenic archaeon mixed culture ISO4-G1]|nr:metallophosphoesterase [methanogenic archaeon mixed culture ISO4-G1]
MDTTMLISLIVEIILVWSVLTAVQFPLRKAEHRLVGSIVFLVKLILIPVVALLFVGIDWVVPYNHGEILCAAYIALIGDVAASLVEYIVRRLMARRNADDGSHHRYDYRVGMSIGLAVCFAMLAFATVNAETMKMDTHEWQADGLEQEHTFAFTADMHAGSSMSMDALRDFCKQVNDSDAEFLILGGDVTDEKTSYEEMVETYEILSSVDIPVFFVFGNHDRQPRADLVGGRTYTDGQLLTEIEGAGITILADDYVQVAGDLVLLGREDISAGDARKDWSELVNPYGGALIVADHQPYDRDQLDVEISALQLSGHTHAGQLWPLHFVYDLLGLPVCGEYDRPGTRLYVTPGTGGWAPLLRTEAQSGWELITLRP